MALQKTREQLETLHGRGYAQCLETRGHAARLRRLVSRVQLDSSQDVVDFACGNGVLLEHVAGLVRSYVGVDFSAACIELANARRARMRAENARFECSAMESFCARHSGFFDTGFALDFSEHVYDDEWISILRSMRVALRRGGRLYLHTPNAEFCIEMLKKHDVLLTQFPEHVAVRTVEHNTRLLREAGFEVSQVALLPHYNALRYLHPLSSIPWIGRYFQARIFIEAANL